MSSDEESILANNKFTKASEYHAVPPLITGNLLTPRVDISFARLDEYAFRNKIIESETTETNKTVGTTNEPTIVKPKSVNETVVSKLKVHRDEVIIEDWTLDNEDDVCGVKNFNSVKPNVTQVVRSQTDKSGQTSQKQGIGFKKGNPDLILEVIPKEGEESEDQGRKFQDIDDDPLVSLVRESMKEKSTAFVTPTKASGEAQEEEISPTI
ncbi:hypothetical protein Tco_0673351 [Tanacetum coccineum]